jgi:pimeloyl-ACP methyl ester carboxylesterase
VAAVAADVAAIADHLGIARFAVAGVSGGGPHALACAALLPRRVQAVVCVASTAPPEAPGLDWYRGMVESNAAELRAAAQGRAPLHAPETRTSSTRRAGGQRSRAVVRAPLTLRNESSTSAGRVPPTATYTAPTTECADHVLRGGPPLQKVIEIPCRALTSATPAAS